jgi:hypothetical protein
LDWLWRFRIFGSLNGMIYFCMDDYSIEGMSVCRRYFIPFLLMCSCFHFLRYFWSFLWVILGSLYGDHFNIFRYFVYNMRFSWGIVIRRMYFSWWGQFWLKEGSKEYIYIVFLDVFCISLCIPVLWVFILSLYKYMCEISVYELIWLFLFRMLCKVYFILLIWGVFYIVWYVVCYV